MQSLNRVENIILAVDGWPFSALYRMALAFGLFAVWTRLYGKGGGGMLAAAFLLTLLLLRYIPAVIRRIVPFSSTLKMMWMDRRETGRKYDSYEWRKLFWSGLGFAAYVLYFGDFERPKMALTLACVCAGFAGIIIYRFGSVKSRH